MNEKRNDYQLFMLILVCCSMLIEAFEELTATSKFNFLTLEAAKKFKKVLVGTQTTLWVGVAPESKDQYHLIAGKVQSTVEDLLVMDANDIKRVEGLITKIKKEREKQTKG